MKHSSPSYSSSEKEVEVEDHEEKEEDLLRLSLCTVSTERSRRSKFPPTTTPPTTSTSTAPFLLNFPLSVSVPEQRVSFVPVLDGYRPPSEAQQAYNQNHIINVPPAVNISHETLAPPAPPLQNSPAAPSHTGRRRRSPAQTLKQGKTENITPPYPWATTRRAKLHRYDYLMENGIRVIRGEVQCKRCEKKYEIEYDLEEKFVQLTKFIEKHRYSMHQRAPSVWMNPKLPDCRFCYKENCVKPVQTKKKSINWLFLLLGQMIGCCKLSELKYFCKHTRSHRTGAKDRLLFLTYFGLCMQLSPSGPFQIF